MFPKEKAWYANEGLSLREISRQTGHSFKTDQKYVYQLDWSEDNLRLPEYPFSVVFRYAALTVNKSGFVTIETNKYGLSPTLAGEMVQAKIFFDHVEFFHDHHLVDSLPVRT